MMTHLKRLLNIPFFLSHVLIPLVVLALYCGSFVYLSSQFLVQGVNYFFASRVGQYAGWSAAFAVLIFLALLWVNPDNRLFRAQTAARFEPSSFLLLLLPLTPVVQYMVNNQDILSMADSLMLALIFLMFAISYIFIVPILLGRMVHTQTLIMMGLAFVFTIAAMPALSSYFAWFEIGSLREQLLVFGSVFLIVSLFYYLDQKATLHLFIVASFVINSAVQMLSKSSSVDAYSSQMDESELVVLTKDRSPSSTPNVYLLVYDSYVPNETMLGYGIDNSAQESFLHEQGFTLYPHTYSLGSSTLTTMNRVLDVAARYTGVPRGAVSGNGVVHRVFQNLGYETYGVFYGDYMFRGIGESYDFAIPEISDFQYVHLLRGIFVGEFRFNIEDVELDKQSRGDFVQSKQKVFEEAPGKRIFLYMHSNLPAHSQKSGSCLSNEIQLYAERLTRANQEMRDDVEVILKSDPNAVVIVAGDHGPYVTRNCSNTTGVYDVSEISRLDIQDRHGTFLAIRWPTQDYVQYDDITVLQDVFPVVLAYLFKDPAILESKVDPTIIKSQTTSGIGIDNGIIRGGIDDGEPLYLADE